METSQPRWRSFLGELVHHWREDDPSFDVRELQQRVLGLAEAQAIVEHLMALGAAPDEWLERRALEALPALLLGLRHDDEAALQQLEAMLGRLHVPEALPALMSVFEHPRPAGRAHLSARPRGLSRLDRCREDAGRAHHRRAGARCASSVRGAGAILGRPRMVLDAGCRGEPRRPPAAFPGMDEAEPEVQVSRLPRASP